MVQVKAADILVMLKSFVAKGQSIKRVTVYPSDYGLQRMAEEAKFGPAGLVDNASLSQRLEGTDLAAPTDRTAGAVPRAGKKGLSKEERAAILETLNEQESDEDREGSACCYCLMECYVPGGGQPYPCCAGSET